MSFTYGYILEFACGELWTLFESSSKTNNKKKTSKATYNTYISENNPYEPTLGAISVGWNIGGTVWWMGTCLTSRRSEEVTRSCRSKCYSKFYCWIRHHQGQTPVLSYIVDLSKVNVWKELTKLSKSPQTYVHILSRKKVDNSLAPSAHPSRAAHAVNKVVRLLRRVHSRQWNIL